MKQYFEILSWFISNWTGYAKDEVFSVSSGNRSGHTIAFQTDSLKILMGILRGSKGGIYGFLMIVDPTQQIEVDKLVCCDSSIRGGLGSVVDIEVNREKKDFDDVARKWLINTMTEWKHDPALARTEADVIGFGKTSVFAFSGGSVTPR